MKKLVLFIGVSALFLTGTAFAQPFLSFDFPRFTEPPELDGIRGEEEWAGAVHDYCSPSKVLEDAENYGWLNEAALQSNMSHNQTHPGDAPLSAVIGEDEDEAEAGTDADYFDNFWVAWDEDGIYYLHEVRDNFHDTTQDAGGNPVAWWERDSISLYIDLTNSNVGGQGEAYEALNIVNFLAEPQSSSAITVTFTKTEAGARVDTQEPDVIDGIEYGYRDAGDEFGGEADYVIEGTVPWDNFMQFNLPEPPTVGSVMGVCWVLPDPDVAPGWNGQVYCWSGVPALTLWYVDLVFSDTPAGPGSGTAVETDSWGRIKATFNQ